MSMNTTKCAYATEQLLEVKNITKSFGNTVVLDDFSYKFERGVYVLSEPSGAGKTTLLRILCGLEVADSGTVLKSPVAKIASKLLDCVCISAWISSNTA